MPEPIDSATTGLTTIANAVRQVYQGFPEESWRFGGIFSRNFKPSSRRINGDGINVQVQSGWSYGVSVNRSLNADWGQAQSISAALYKATLAESSASNDFSVGKGRLRVTLIDLQRMYTDQAWAVDYIKRLIMSLGGDFDESFAVLRNLDKTARTGIVSGTPRQNDNTVFANCTATPAASTGARFVVATGAIAFFQTNRQFDVYTSGGVFKSRLIVTDMNPADNSVGVYLMTQTGSTWAVDTAAVVGTTKINDGDYLYYMDAKGAGMNSMGEWFATPVSGESFFGKDRTSPANRWMIPITFAPGSVASPKTFSKTYLDSAANMMYGVSEDPETSYFAQMQPGILQKFRDQVGENVIIQFPTTEQMGALAANYGFGGLPIYAHPRFGRLILHGDPLAYPNVIRAIRLGDWEQFNGLADNVYFLPGSTGGYWNREPSATPGNGYGTTYSMDGICLKCDGCLVPRQQWQILGVN